MNHFLDTSSSRLRRLAAIRRIVFDLLVLVLVLFFPWWLATGLAFLGVLVFRNYIEVIVVGLVLDGLYGGLTLRQPLSIPIATLGGVVWYGLGTYVQRRLRL